MLLHLPKGQTIQLKNKFTYLNSICTLCEGWFVQPIFFFLHQALGFATRSLHQCCRAQYSHPM